MTKMRELTEEDIEAFEAALRRAEKAEETVKKYGAALRRLRIWLDGAPVTKEALLSWRRELAGSLAAQTVNGYISALNAWLEQTGRPDCRIRHLRVQRKLFSPPERELSRKEYDRLVRTARRQNREQLLLILETICSTGIRVSELRFITVEALAEGRAEISLKGKVRVILLPCKLRRKLRRFAGTQGIASGPLFLGRHGAPLARQQIWAQMKSLCRQARVEPSKVFPHNLRHLFARCFYRSCRDVARLADVLGHSSIETTRIYLKTAGDEHVRTLESLGLVSGEPERGGPERGPSAKRKKPRAGLSYGI